MKFYKTLIRGGVWHTGVSASQREGEGGGRAREASKGWFQGALISQKCPFVRPSGVGLFFYTVNPYFLFAR